MKDGITEAEYTDFLNHLFLQEMVDIEYQQRKQKDRFPYGIMVIRTK